MVLLSYYADGELLPMDSQSVTYGPGDTQSVFFSPIFCQQLSPASGTLYSSSYEPSQLYLLNTDPTLTGKANITFEDRVVVFDQHNQRNFHLYPNSVITFDICAKNDTYSGFASFYLLKGQKLYKEWVKQGVTTTPRYEEYLQVREICSEGQQAFAHEVAEEEQYYLVVVNDKHIDPQTSEIIIRYEIQRTVYEFNQSSVAVSCNFSTSPCSIHIPFHPSITALLVYGAPLDWGGSWENKQISVNCGARVWLYAVMSVAGVLLIAAGTMCLCFSCCCCNRFISGDEEDMNKPLLNEHTAHMYDFRSTSSEMSNPTGDSYARHKATPSPQIAFRHTKSPHPPPSFKASGKFSLGSPTCETFTH